MGLLNQLQAYIKANTPRSTRPVAKPADVIDAGLLNPNQYNAPAANRFKDSAFGLLGIVPGVGDAASAVESADLFNRGEKFAGSLAALGALPMVPALAGMVKRGGKAANAMPFADDVAQKGGGLLGNVDNALNMYGGQKIITKQEFDRMESAIKDIERASEEHGQVFIRWSPTKERDLAPGSRSRDFVSGETHGGLSAVPITADMHPVDIAKRLNEYSFLRINNNNSVPRVYLGERVGTDSDGYALIKPSSVMREFNGDEVSILDRGFVEAFDANDSLINDLSRDQTNSYVQERIRNNTAKLKKFIKD